MSQQRPCHERQPVAEIRITAFADGRVEVAQHGDSRALLAGIAHALQQLAPPTAVAPHVH